MYEAPCIASMARVRSPAWVSLALERFNTAGRACQSCSHVSNVRLLQIPLPAYLKEMLLEDGQSAEGNIPADAEAAAAAEGEDYKKLLTDLDDGESP